MRGDLGTGVRLRARTAAAVLVLMFAVALSAAAVEVQDVPTPRPRGWVTDEAGVLTPAERDAIDQMGDSVRKETGGEMAVVILPSLEGRESRPFALELFNHWGIGRAEANDGVLLLVSMGDRAVEIVLGDGVDGPREQKVSDRVMERQILPNFRDGRPGEGLRAGYQQLALGVYRVDPFALWDETRAEAPPEGTAPAEADARAAVSGAERKAVREAAARESTRNADRAAARLTSRADRWDIGTGLGCLFSLGLFLFGPIFLYRLLRRALRRQCPDCKATMRRLSETEDDAHLTAAERTEERVGSVSYTVWACPQCGRAEKKSTNRLFSPYTPCPQCGRRTRNRVTEVLVRPTYEAPGQGRLEEHCAHCDYRNAEVYTLPVLQRTVEEPASRRRSRASRRRGGVSSDDSSPSWSFGSSGSSSFSSGSSSSSSGFSGGHSSSSSSSSSSGSSGFSGGSSSGGGSSGKW